MESVSIEEILKYDINKLKAIQEENQVIGIITNKGRILFYSEPEEIEFKPINKIKE